MTARKELHVLLRGVEQLKVAGSDTEFDVYAVISCGHQQHRSRLIEHTAAPDWNEEFVFDGSSISSDEVVKIKLYNQGMFQDELLFYAYLELSYCDNLDSPTQQQQQQYGNGAQAGFRDETRPRRFKPSAGGVLEEDEFETIEEGEEEGVGSRSISGQPGTAAAAAAAAAAGRQPSASQPPAAADAVARMSDITTESLALLSASKLSGSSSSSGGGGGLLSMASGLSSGRSGRNLSKLRLKRSTHVRSARDLVVSAWWVLQPPVVDSGVPPTVLSFVHPPGCPHTLPSATHTDIASLWEEPCLTFVRLVVSQVSLGPAASAAAATVAVGEAGGSSSSSRDRRKASKTVLKRLTGLLKGEPAAAEEVAAAAAAYSSDDESSRPFESRPSLSDIHGAGSLTQSFRITGAPGITQFDWQAHDDEPSDDETEYASTFGDSSTISSSTPWDISSTAQHRRSNGNGAADKQTSSSSRRDKQLYLSVKIQLGNLEPQALKPVELNPDGSADVKQAAVFAVLRPLEEADITYQLGLQRGPRGSPLLTLVFQYSMLHLLRRSPQHSFTWEEWKAVARATVPGLQVPLLVLPMAWANLSAFLADADCRAGMYQVPAVSAAAVAAAAADDAAAAAAAATEAEAAAVVAEEAAAAADSDASLTDSEDSGESPHAADVMYDYVIADQRSGGLRHGVSPTAAAAAAAAAAAGSEASGFRQAGVLRRRPAPGSAAAAAEEAAAAEAAAAAAKQREQAGKGSKRPHLDKWRSRMLSGVEAGLNQAMEKLPENVAQKVQGRFLNRIFPHSRRSEVFSIGQLRVLSTKPGHAAAAGSSSIRPTAGVPPPASPPGTNTPPSPIGQQQQQQQQQLSPWNVSAGLLSAKTGAEQAAAVAAAAAAAAKEAAAVVPLQDHPNVATAGDPAAGPLGVLQLTLQSINVRKGSLSAGYSLLLKSGPHWLELSPAALPLTIYSSSASTTGSSSEAGAWTAESNKAPALQVMIPVYGSSCLVALVLHRRSSVVGRCVFRLYGLLPLLLRDYTKSLVLYSDKRGNGGGRIIAGNVLLRLSAMPSPNSSWLPTCARLAFSYLVTPHTLSMHTSGVLETLGRDELTAAAGRVVSEWLAEQGQAVVPDSLVRQLVSSGRTALSTRSMKGHIRRIQAVMLDWLPRRLDPLAFYYWKRPLHNLLALWVLSHACLYPGHWMLAMALLLVVVMLWHLIIQIRRGVLGFEMEQLLPTEIGASLADLQQQQQQQGDYDDLSDCGSAASGSDLGSQLRGSGSGQLRDKLKYKEAAGKIREAMAAGRQELRSKLHGSDPQQPPAAKLPSSIAELREQLEAGTLSLDALDIEAAAQQLLSVGGVLKLARKHSSYMLEYALIAQNLLDDAAGFAEGIYAMATAQDPLAALLLCTVLLSAASFCYVAGLGAGVWVLIAVLLRPPVMRGVPGVFGWKAILAHLRGHGRSLEELAW